MASAKVEYESVLYDRIKSLFTGDEITIENIFDLLILAMEQVERFTELSGAVKKKLVLQTVQRLVHDFVVVSIENDLLRLIIDNFLGTLIDTLVQVDGGSMRINLDKKKLARKLLPCCFKN